MTSIAARLIFDVIMPILGTKDEKAPPTTASTMIANRRPPAPLPHGKNWRVENRNIAGGILHTLRYTKNVSKTTPDILYLPGGSYTHSTSKYHWRMLKWFARKSGATIFVFSYPLAPEHDLSEIHASCLEVWRDISPAHNLVVMGDSAGGGLALRLVQHIRELGLQKPVAMVLISPFVTTKMTPETETINPRDPMLSLSHTRQHAAVLAKGRPFTHPDINPIHGGLADLPPTLVLNGGRDIIYPGGQKLVRDMHEANQDVTEIAAPDMIHVWPLFPINEAIAARKKILRFVQTKTRP